MSAAVDTYRDDLEATYAVDFSRDREPIKARKRFPEYRRTGGAPTRVGGMHCRRAKRWTWGSGRGARMLNARAFASCVAFAVASLAATAFGAPITIDMVTVGNAGNPGVTVPIKPNGTTVNWNNAGAVGYEFQIGRYETTNAEYTAFLNAVDPTASLNPSNVYVSDMGSNVNGGIFSTPGSGYTVRPGYAQLPVTYTNWFSAARFVNWLAGGQRTGADGRSDMEGGFAGSAYTLQPGTTTGAPVARNAGATYVLPSLNEWYKAAFYTGSGSSYWLYSTASNTAPTAGTDPTTAASPNGANYGFPQGFTGGITPVNYYVNATSFYGLYGAYGNLLELTDTVSPNDSLAVMAGGGNWLASGSMPGIWSSSTVRFVAADTIGNVNGFRVAAVPEPSTVVLAGIGLAGLAGLGVRRSRKAKAAAAAA